MRPVRVCSGANAQLRQPKSICRSRRPCSALRAHHGQGENIIFTNPLFKGFCRAFCKKLAAGGIRVPDKSKVEDG